MLAIILNPMADEVYLTSGWLITCFSTFCIAFIVVPSEEAEGVVTITIR